ncbi:hypothetical protein GGR53DRAFT_386637 [Hypoxylon sp. FL1150]|nr:hypothetical protein GGR53DRAFT_386637 [Hypoxylon sp. FL1150]
MQYQSCALAVSTENLQAIEGIASRMASLRSDRYYYGYWINDLPKQLMWCGTASKPPELKDRPSWSWSSTAMGTQIFPNELNMTNLCRPFKPYSINSLLVHCSVYAPVRLSKPDLETRGEELRVIVCYTYNGPSSRRLDNIGADLRSISDDLIYDILDDIDEIHRKCPQSGIPFWT